jgi:hypothetical protein
MDDLTGKLLLLGVGGAIAFLATWFWKSKDRKVQTEDAATSADMQERKELAAELATMRRETALKLEADRREAAARLEVEHKQLVTRFETRDKILDDRLTVIDSQMAMLMTQVSPLWAAVQSKIAKDLTHPSPQFEEMDALLRDLEALKLSTEGKERLLVLLEERIHSVDPEVTEAEKESARLLEGVMEKVLEEAETDTPLVDLKIIGEKEQAEEG